MFHSHVLFCTPEKFNYLVLKEWQTILQLQYYTSKYLNVDDQCLPCLFSSKNNNSALIYQHVSHFLCPRRTLCVKITQLYPYITYYLYFTYLCLCSWGKTSTRTTHPLIHSRCQVGNPLGNTAFGAPCHFYRKCILAAGIITLWLHGPAALHHVKQMTPLANGGSIMSPYGSGAISRHLFFAQSRIVFAILLVSCCLSLTSGLPLEDFYPFSESDNQTEHKDDGGSPLIHLPVNFPFFNRPDLDQLYVYIHASSFAIGVLVGFFIYYFWSGESGHGHGHGHRREQPDAARRHEEPLYARMM